MNMNLYGHDGQWLMVDCGVTFDEPLTINNAPIGGVNHDIVCAAPTFVTKQKEALCGIVITHAHEDHVGALPYLWHRFKCPVYTTPYTAEILRRKVARLGKNTTMNIVEVGTGDSRTIGGFNVTWMALTHSIPEPHGLLIETAAGRIFHTADWKIDPAPVTGKPFNPQPFKQMAEEPVLAMVCDSTNATREGYSISEQQCYKGLLSHIEPAPGRVIVGCFSSNIARLITLAKIAKKTGRYLSLFGRSLQNTVSVAKATGHWPDDLDVIESSHTGYLLPNEVLAVATGSQGEPRAALSRLSQDTYRDVSVDAGDKIIFSAILIPGNEMLVSRIIKAFKAKRVDVVLPEDSELPIHASGHPCVEELKLMYDWVKPYVAVPTHGEPEHLSANADIATECEVPRTLTGLNGDLFMLSPNIGIRRKAIPTGRIAIQQDTE